MAVIARTQKIAPCLWFDHQAEDAAKFYASIFRDSRIGKITRHAEGERKGSVLAVDFSLEGQDFMAINGGPMFDFTPAISFLVHCENQVEVDHYWDNLLDCGEPMQCGWLTDKFGVTWQVAPTVLLEMVSDSDPEKVQRAMSAMMGMVKLNVKELQAAFDG